METSKCPKCNATIESGVTICGNCDSNIVWKKGQPKISVGDKMEEVGKNIRAIGCLITVIGIIILIFFMFLL